MEFKNRQSGFTLVEIAIVMVIIGLLLGGVLKGQALVENARMKNITNDINGVQSMYYAYQDRKRTTPAADTAYSTTPPTSGKFWDQMRTENLASGTLPPQNPWGGYIGVELGVVGTRGNGLSGNVVCTSVPSNYAQSIDAAVDDGVGTSGNMTSNGGADASVNLASAAGSSGFSTDGSKWTVLCLKL